MLPMTRRKIGASAGLLTRSISAVGPRKRPAAPARRARAKPYFGPVGLSGHGLAQGGESSPSEKDSSQ
jgi:hypothetical protein